ncbi:MAG: TetM/TetW/TetO/TetS family tetracycline resistance ribosomal protection protein, partial [Planctomycetota bacterium]|nr:TetM/TetW/TetO/TetS family tetracycline resistance ribosomal protection protein [Planctomycetota bacterium]
MGPDRIRNFGIAAHIDAGKTTVSERMLYYSGVEHRIGQVDEGTAVMDWMAEERERGITITAAATRVPWRDHALNLIDTPGHVDFTVEVERCMRVLDGAVLVLDAVSGVQAQSETVWRQMAHHGVPAIAFVNKCDRPGADFLAAVATLEERLGAPGIPIQLPLESTGDTHLIADLVTGRALRFHAAREGRDPEVVDPPPAAADEIGVLRSDLIEALAEGNEALLACVVEEREPPIELLVAALKERVLARTLVPVLCGAALRNYGVQPLLDAVVDYLPSPLEVPAVEGVDPSTLVALTRAPEADEPLAALAFKLHAGPHGDLTFLRIYAGRLTPGQALINPRAGKKERVARILRMHSESSESLERAEAGDIVAVTGLKWTGTGDTLCVRESPILLEALEFPEPVITRVVEPASGAERDRLRQALERLSHEDPSLHVREDVDSGQWTIAGMGELHLEVVAHRLEAEFGLAPRVGQPRVAYRETVQSTAAGRGVVDRSLAGKEVYATLELALSPAHDGLAPRVTLAGDCLLPVPVRSAVEEALVLEAQVGPRFGFPLVRAAIEIGAVGVRDGKISDAAFCQAAVAALRQAMAAADCALEEPMMAFEIQTPGEFSSGIIADLNSRDAELTEV